MGDGEIKFDSYGGREYGDHSSKTIANTSDFILLRKQVIWESLHCGWSGMLAIMKSLNVRQNDQHCDLCVFWFHKIILKTLVSVSLMAFDGPATSLTIALSLTNMSTNSRSLIGLLLSMVPCYPAHRTFQCIFRRFSFQSRHLSIRNEQNMLMLVVVVVLLMLVRNTVTQWVYSHVTCLK